MSYLKKIMYCVCKKYIYIINTHILYFILHLLIREATDLYSLCLSKPQILNGAEIPEALVLLQVPA